MRPDDEFSLFSHFIFVSSAPGAFFRRWVALGCENARAGMGVFSRGGAGSRGVEGSSSMQGLLESEATSEKGKAAHAHRNRSTQKTLPVS